MPASLYRYMAVAMLLPVGLAAAVPLDEPIKPVPQSLNQDPARAAIGARLFNDVRLSGNNRVSCASCHALERGGADGRALSLGQGGLQTRRNTPTVLNAALNFKQFWDGRADTLEAQIEQVVVNPIEMGAVWPEVVAKVMRDVQYGRGFELAYRDGVTKANIVNALATYERTLITPNARFDRYLRGETGAISEAEKSGYAKFKQFGCVACHQGVNVGGNMFQKFGVMGGDLARGGDPGRYAVTGKEGDRGVYKVPGLRNVALTAPYFHDASAATLGQAVDVMFKYQLGRTGSAADKAAIVAFLNTLNAVPAGGK